MKFVGILLEGQAEELFVNEVLNPYLSANKLYLVATIIKTKRTDLGSFKGGVSNYTKMKQDLERLFQNQGNIATTTMFDLYGLPSDFPNRQNADAKSKTGAALAEFLQEKWLEQYPNQKNFIPYLAVHEFEALLFSEPEKIALNFPDLGANTGIELQKIRAGYENPEAINLHQPPAKRIMGLIPEYFKRFDGIRIAKAIGIPKMREECPHFHTWLSRLENL